MRTNVRGDERRERQRPLDQQQFTERVVSAAAAGGGKKAATSQHCSVCPAVSNNTGRL